MTSIHSVQNNNNLNLYNFLNGQRSQDYTVQEELGFQTTGNIQALLNSNPHSLKHITDGILLAPRKDMIKWNYFHGPNPYKFPLDKRTSVDVDDGLDLACARAWLDMDESVSQINPYIING